MSEKFTKITFPSFEKHFNWRLKNCYRQIARTELLAWIKIPDELAIKTI